MDFLNNALEHLKPSLDDDFVDRLNYYYTPSMLLIFALIISAKQWVGQPIECWVPAQFTGAWEQYTEDYCFVQNTYMHRMREMIPVSHYKREQKEIGYYQWVPFILAFQAMFFYLPYMFWNLVNWQTGFDIHGICSEAEKATEMDPKDQKRFMDSLTQYVRQTLMIEKEVGNRCCFGCWNITATHYGFYVVSVHILMKVLFLCNAVLQIFFMNSILGTEDSLDSSYGLWTFFNMLKGVQWEKSGIFPRVTMCDFEVRVLGNLHRYTVQCVLMINMFNEKIYLFTWHWTLVLIVCNLVNVIYWIGISINPSERISYISSYIEPTSEALDETELRWQKKFTLRYLRQDGVFLIRKIASNTSTVTAVRLTRNLYEEYMKMKARKRWKNGNNSFDTKASQTDINAKQLHLQKEPYPGVVPLPPAITADTTKTGETEDSTGTSSPSPPLPRSLNPFNKKNWQNLFKIRHV